ncbi:hypothetical protein [Virgibacillus sp. Bac330]|uniref:hypothetical protein n=1 Tax=Virgibacillus sp. Bac330 TaxID=2419841 RepID=UPI0013CE750A|nr:hypothetical protein [Virgibacillus sp. Bac330]
MNEKDLHRVLIKKELWDLQHVDVEAFKEAVKDYIEKGYPEYTPIKASKGFILCRRDRR